MKKLLIVLAVLLALAGCDLFGPDFVGSWSGMDGGWPVTYTFTRDSVEYAEGTAPAFRGPLSNTDTVISFRFTEFYVADQWWPITDDMPWYADTNTVWGWSVEGSTLFLLRGLDTLTLIKD